MSERPIDDGEQPDAVDHHARDPRELTADELDELEMAAARRKFEQEQRQAWGKWRQDRELNRRKVLRSLIGLVVGAVLAGLLAYGCDAIKGPRHVGLAHEVGGYVLQPPTPDTQRVAGQLEAAGATGPAAGIYRGPQDVLFVAGYSTDVPVDVVEQLLPPAVGADNDYQGRGGPLTCGATADGSRCVWKSSDIVGGTSARGVPPDQLEKITRDLRAGAIR